MNTSLRDRNSLARSANLSSSTSRLKTRPFRTSTNTLSRTSADPNLFENIEIDYIKNLQQQIHYLELECTYLRKQLDLNGLKMSASFDQRDALASMQMERVNLERTLLEENKKKESALNALQTTEKTFHVERDLLLKEINALKKIKNELEETLVNKNVEVTKLKENLTRHHMENTRSSQDFTKIELQVDGLRKDNLALREEINEARTLLISRDSLIKSLQQELADTSTRKIINNDLKNSVNDLSAKLSMTSELLGKESNNSKLILDQNMRYERELNDYKNRLSELNAENSRLSNALEMSLKQNEADLVMAKKNADLAKANLEQIKSELERERALNMSLNDQLEQFKSQERMDVKSQLTLKKRVSELEELLNSRDLSIRTLQDQMRQKHKEAETERGLNESLRLSNRNLEAKINEVNDSIDKLQLGHKVNSESTKNKLTHLQSDFDNATMALNNQINANKTLQLKVESLLRQESVNLNLITSLRQRIVELETQLQEHLLKEPKFISQLQEANLNLGRLEEENSRLRSEIDLLSVRLKEIDRLKQLEDLIQSQRWQELGDLADSMKNLSVMMAPTSGGGPATTSNNSI